MRAEYFPCNEKYKRPIGGVATGEDFTISLVCHDAESVIFALTKEGEYERTVFYPMERREDGFSLTMAVTTSGLYFYRFIAKNAYEEKTFYCGSDLSACEYGGEWQLTAYEKNYETPSTFDGGVIYQIMVDRFNIGSTRNRTKSKAVYRDDWGGLPVYKPDEKGVVRNNDFFGGNLSGVTQKLDYLKSLNVKCIYLNPIFEATSNHKYDTGNYLKVDSDFGTEEDLKTLIDEAKKRGINIILDGVFSHTGDDSIYFNKYGSYDSVGAYQSKDSPYFKWYDFTTFPNKYASWWGINTLPCVNETEQSYDEFINGDEGVVNKYMRMGIAGFRLDVADELPDGFLDNLSKAVKKVNENGMVLGEVWEDASNKVAYSYRRRYLLGKQLDSVTNYPFKNAIINFVLSGNEKLLTGTLYSVMNNYPKRVLDNLMNLLGTHDTARILTELSGEQRPQTKDERATFTLKDREKAKVKLLLASVLQYTLPGVPCVYYGDEAGMEGYEDPFNRRCYPWGSEDEEIIEHYKRLGALRKRAELNGGNLKINYASGGVIDFTRGDSLRIVVNAGEKEYELGKEVTDEVTGTSKRTLKRYDFAVFIE